jgi:hypothetical protein
MTTTKGAKARVLYRAKLIELSLVKPEGPEEQSHWAKYLCILISGYLEQSVKEVLFEFGTSQKSPKLSNYIETSWPKSRNMNIDVIREILGKFDANWQSGFSTWLGSDDSLKRNMEALMRSRNDIAHGKEANTTNVTLTSSKERMLVAFQLIDFVEGLVLTPAADTDADTDTDTDTDA